VLEKPGNRSHLHFHLTGEQWMTNEIDEAIAKALEARRAWMEKLDRVNKQILGTQMALGGLNDVTLPFEEKEALAWRRKTKAGRGVVVYLQCDELGNIAIEKPLKGMRSEVRLRMASRIPELIAYATGALP
jgi:hypothetical protein